MSNFKGWSEEKVQRAITIYQYGFGGFGPLPVFIWLKVTR